MINPCGGGAPCSAIGKVLIITDVVHLAAQAGVCHSISYPHDYADVSRLQALTGSSSPATALEEGVRRFVAWYRNYQPAALASSAWGMARKSGQSA